MHTEDRTMALNILKTLAVLIGIAAILIVVSASLA
jgi:hypothetical protein